MELMRLRQLTMPTDLVATVPAACGRTCGGASTVTRLRDVVEIAPEYGEYGILWGDVLGESSSKSLA